MSWRTRKSSSSFLLKQFARSSIRSGPETCRTNPQIEKSQLVQDRCGRPDALVCGPYVLRALLDDVGWLFLGGIFDRLTD
jgi:hypothetical protein